MLNENIKILRKKSGLSQETMAQQLNVVRQTVSKWEQGLSVPDAEMLKRISELLEVPVSTLLGVNIEEKENSEHDRIEDVARQLAILNEQLANKAANQRRFWKRLIIGFTVSLILLFGLYVAAIYFYKVKPRQNWVLKTVHVECELNGETYGYGITYNENFEIVEAGGSVFIAYHVDVEKYDDANDLLAHIEDYFIEHGGTYKII